MDQYRGLKLLFAALPLLTGWLYLVGLAHHQGYLTTYGAHYSLFEIDLEGALVSGFISIFTMSFPAILYAAGIIAALVISLAIIGAVSTNRRPRVVLSRFFKRLKAKRKPLSVVPEVGKMLEGVLTLNSFLGAITFVLLLLGISVALGQKSGEDSARRDMKKFLSQETSGVVIDGSRKQVVKCSDSFCLIWDGVVSSQISRDALNRVPLPPNKVGSGT